MRYIILRALLLSACILLAKGNICFAISRSAARQADEIKQARLVSLARRAGLNQLTDCEKKVVYAATVGDEADCGDKADKEVPAPSEGFWQSYDEVQNGPSKDATNKQLSDLRVARNKLNNWLRQPQPFDLNIRLVRWLSTDPEAVKLVDPRGIQVDGARVTDALDLSFAEVKFPLVFKHSLFQERINFIGAQLAKLDLRGSRLLKGIVAYSVTVSTIINLSDVTSQGKVTIANGKLGSDLICSGGIFNKQEGTASDPKAPSMPPNSKQASQKKTASGLMNGENGKAKNHKDGLAVQGQEQNDEETVLDARDLKARNVKLNRGFSATGMVDLSGADLSDSLDCRGGKFSNPDGTALNAEDLKAADVKLSSGFSATGMVDLSGADLSDSLDCRGGKFSNPAGSTRSMVYAPLGNSTGPLNEPPIPNETNINGDETGLHAPAGIVLDAKNRIYVADDGGDDNPPSILVYKAGSNGNEAPIATISGDETGLHAPAGIVLDAKNRIHVADDGNTNPALAAVELKARDVFLGDTREKFIAKGLVDLSNAAVSGLLHDIPASWGKLDPVSKKFKYGSGSDISYTLDGFVYGGFVYPWTVHDHVEWLKGQSPFATQPYEQLAKILRDNGHDSDSRQVLIAMEYGIREQEAKQQPWPLRWLTTAWSWILHWTIGYGYNTWYAILGSAILLLVGSYVFSRASRHHDPRWIISTEDSEETYKPFSSIVYALETLLPFVDLYQAKHWVPNAQSRGGRRLRWYLWAHTILGWYFASMILAGLSGIVQK